MSGLFQEKQSELQTAVLRVEQLSLQLEDLRRGKLNGLQTALGGQVTGTAALELRKLYQELQVPCDTRNTAQFTDLQVLFNFECLMFVIILYCIAFCESFVCENVF